MMVFMVGVFNLEIIDIEAIKKITRRAGSMALSHFGKVKPEVKSDFTIVTKADRQIEAYLKKKISALYPDHGIIGEESGASKSIENYEYVWAIDPIDGTVAFTWGLPVWGISIGVIKDGIPIAGFVYLPLVKNMYCASQGKGAYLNDEQLFIKTGSEINKDDFLAVPSNCHRRFYIDFSGKCRSLGSTAAHMVYVAQNAAWAALLGRVGIWDIAAGAAIVKEAGGNLEYLGEKKINWTKLFVNPKLPDYVLVGTDPKIELLRQKIKVRK